MGNVIYVEDKHQFVGEYVKQIDINKYGKGIYFLEIETHNGIINKKEIITKRSYVSFNKKYDYIVVGQGLAGILLVTAHLERNKEEINC